MAKLECPKHPHAPVVAYSMDGHQFCRVCHCNEFHRVINSGRNYVFANFQPEAEYPPIAVVRAKELYYKHMGLDPTIYDFMWGQCSDEYQKAWILIARVELNIDDPSNEDDSL
ncbi:hypothetical protein NVP1188A_72 [Vibrio phage 1.188.A._10N.286.51.A6]|uniref:Uncharacterized protein n=5 Tax=Mukerjeevirus TaxID=2733146 RepID=A0A2I7REI8_9CAUD|nr:hypothetical protein HOU76_gp52 [Vibrio phage 1.169.O._10N.261.52.B1]YP_009817531.1 hypothetical protein HOU77_gp34 [Vibrio phage 1.188.A._10N.286.51.A6]YP_009817671.1 hypothetical protein HOU79_gp35 [Vibrio phage 1.224.A._10N.261.48.B1]AUR93726.1 hypothetical protein NVP1188B_72 [Vibrio phage 1.188.B._10N.286.51.A6]AUR93812.1 hypothetical protein NVP1188C_72 [Vibrio phage 1.188.C._10N.286.51.A6]AUR92075.1 hypothetical protein NVP1169O_47 [Vibrio phage 1.169.O._10N.261.52.B1]AUR93640.1 hyp